MIPLIEWHSKWNRSVAAIDFQDLISLQSRCQPVSRVGIDLGEFAVEAKAHAMLTRSASSAEISFDRLADQRRRWPKRLLKSVFAPDRTAAGRSS